MDLRTNHISGRFKETPIFLNLSQINQTNPTPTILQPKRASSYHIVLEETITPLWMKSSIGQTPEDKTPVPGLIYN